MKSYIAFFLICLSFLSCKKTVEAVQEDLVIKAMTDGHWKIVKFIKGGTDVTADFSPYRFQFRSNYTVEALNNSTIESIGTWNASASDRTIASAFTNASTTVSLLNGTWQITNNSWTFVEATQTVNTEVRTLRLEK